MQYKTMFKKIILTIYLPIYIFINILICYFLIAFYFCLPFTSIISYKIIAVSSFFITFFYCSKISILWNKRKDIISFFIIIMFSFKRIFIMMTNISIVCIKNNHRNSVFPYHNPSQRQSCLIQYIFIPLSFIFLKAHTSFLCEQRAED